MSKVAIYTRLSEEDRDKQKKGDFSQSIKNQISMLKDYANEQQWIIYDIYNDDDYKGSDRRRPEFNRLLKDAEEHKFDIVLCKTQSRFTRELELVERILHDQFPLWGIRFVSIVDRSDTSVKGNKKSRQINGLVNEWYLEDLSDNIRSTLASLREKGYHTGGLVLYGYKKDPDNKGKIIVDEEAAETVREIFTLYAKGYGKSKIARILNEKGIPNPTEYKRLQDIHYKTPAHKSGTLWKYFSVANTLSNEMYIGNMVQGRYGSISYKSGANKPKPRDEWVVVEGTHEPIISKELWDMVQAKINANYKPFSNNGQIGIFSKKVRCMGCGYYLQTHITNHRRMLRCPTRKANVNSCEGAYITYTKLEQIVLKEINKLIQQYFDAEHCMEMLHTSNSFAQRKEKLLRRRKQYKQMLDQNSLARKNLYRDKIKEFISEKEYIELYSEISMDEEKYEALIHQTELELESMNDDAPENRIAELKKYEYLPKLTREATEILIDCIYVGPTIKGTRNHPIEIYWNF